MHEKKIGKKFRLWNNLENSKTSLTTFSLTIQSMKWTGPLQNFKTQTACFLKLIQSTKWLEFFQSFIYQIACLKNQTVEKLIPSINKLELFQNFWSSYRLFRNLKFFVLISSKKPFGMFHSLNCQQKNFKILANRFNIWNEMKPFSFPNLKMLA